MVRPLVDLVSEEISITLTSQQRSLQQGILVPSSLDSLSGLAFPTIKSILTTSSYMLVFSLVKIRLMPTVIKSAVDGTPVESYLEK